MTYVVKKKTNRQHSCRILSSISNDTLTSHSHNSNNTGVPPYFDLNMSTHELKICI